MFIEQYQAFALENWVDIIWLFMNLFVSVID